MSLRRYDLVEVFSSEDVCQMREKAYGEFVKHADVIDLIEDHRKVTQDLENARITIRNMQALLKKKAGE